MLETPCVQVALDFIDEETPLKVAEALRGKKLIFEAGTPLIKQFGIGIVQKIKDAAKANGASPFVVADLKTLDVGALEIKIAKNGGADAAVCSGLASHSTIDSFISEASKQNIISIVDMMGVGDPSRVLTSLINPPEIVLLHRSIDSELAGEKRGFDALRNLKARFPHTKIAIAGGINAETGREAVAAGADILIVGRYITASADPAKAADEMTALFVGSPQSRAQSNSSTLSNLRM